MNPLYEKLLTGYAAPPQLSLSEDTRRHLEELIFDRYLQWSTDAFALGLPLGLALAHDNIRRGCPQQL